MLSASRHVRSRLRQFHTTTLVSSSVRKKLNILLSTNQVPRNFKTSNQRKRDEALAVRESAARQTRRLNKGHALEILQHKLHMNITEYDAIHDVDLPSADEFHKKLDVTERRVLYNILGTSGDQLKDTFVVEKDVLRFLRKGHVNKALYVSRIAGKEGVVGMNRVMEYLLLNNRFNAALEVFVKRKKWGVDVNELTYTILFAGAAKQNSPLTALQAEKLARVFYAAARNARWNAQHFNACLNALFHSDKPERAWELFHYVMSRTDPTNTPVRVETHDHPVLEQMEEAKHISFQPTATTFTTIFNYLKTLEDELDRVRRAEMIWRMVLKHRTQPRSQLHIDAQLVLSYAAVFRSPALMQRAAQILQKWFHIPELTPALAPAMHAELMDIAEVNPTPKRFPADPHAMQVFLDLTKQLHSPKEACTVFQTWVTSLPAELDVVVYDSYMRNFTEAYHRSTEEFLMNDQYAQLTHLRTNKMYEALQLTPQIVTTGLVGYFAHTRYVHEVTRLQEVSREKRAGKEVTAARAWRIPTDTSERIFNDLNAFWRVTELQPRRNRQLVAVSLSYLHWYCKSVGLLTLSRAQAETVALQFFNSCEKGAIALRPLVELRDFRRDMRDGRIDLRAVFADAPFYAQDFRVHPRELAHLPARIKDVSITICAVVGDLASRIEVSAAEQALLDGRESYRQLSERLQHNTDYDSVLQYKYALLEYKKRLTRHTRVLEATFYEKNRSLETIDKSEEYLMAAQKTAERFILHQLGVKVITKRNVVAELVEEIRGEEVKGVKNPKREVVYTKRKGQAKEQKTGISGTEIPMTEAAEVKVGIPLKPSGEIKGEIESKTEGEPQSTKAALDVSKDGGSNKLSDAK
ncbi:hypothetical protein BABINDRAFT_168286 [Babjeviella inositovora NRRL Y-12698]|uniref:Mitochondrial 15S rRNA processing factor CCM1 n=1 Tax=Babjeviella inositovora NRRL Y-12698 TaxID=984486 RepID=A0A1E3QN94_9ASCO|nr:uncharacterized protein BABINDRAFT_168286 [Babjeviella inositovora NRRL Y-12698]ODQ78562.1 hypothetical protein BABINDRAFT_168286 [Babjeviella inositovora NRRL Y-12698]